MKIFLTGATGFIGSKVLKMLTDEGHYVTCLRRHTSRSVRVQDIASCAWVYPEQLEEAFCTGGFDCVIHCATTYGRSADQFFDVYAGNFSLAMQLLELSSQNNVRLFINTDSFFVRELENGIREGQTVYMDSYTKSKFMFRETARVNIKQLNISFANLQLQHVYGTGDSEGKFIYFLKKNLMANVPSLDLTAGTQLRDWTWAGDVVAAYKVLLDNIDTFAPSTFHEFQAGTGKMTSLRRVCELMKDLSSSKTELNFGAREMNPGELQSSCADNSSLTALGWKWKVDIEEGLRRILAE